MLHLWPNQILVSLGAERIEVISRNGLNKHVSFQREMTINNVQAKSWSNAIHQLDTVLSELKLTEKAHLCLTLSSDLVRFITLPPQSIVVNSVEKQAYAKATFQEIYGSISAGWAIKCHPAAPQHTTVCAAIDQTLIDAIDGLAVKHKLTLKSVQPYFMSAYNRLSHQIKKTSHLLVIVEYNHIVIANIVRGQCQQIRNMKISENWQKTLEQTLAREKLLGNHESEDVMVYAPMHKTTKIQPIKGWQFKQLHITNNKTGKAQATDMLEVLA